MKAQYPKEYYAKAPKVMLNDKHLTYQLRPYVYEICRPLFEKHNIQHFYYLHFDLNKEETSRLTTIPDDNRYVFEKQEIARGPELDAGIHYLPLFRAAKGRAEIGKRFNMDNILEFVDNHGNGIVEIFGFGTHCNQSEMANYYFDHLEAFRRYTLEFKDQAKEMIVNALKQPVAIPGHNRVLIKDSIQIEPPKKHELFIANGKKITLSQREFDVLTGLCKGLTAKETARFLNISPRTVETYLEQLKNKLEISKKAEFFKVLSDSDILHLLKKAK